MEHYNSGHFTPPRPDFTAGAVDHDFTAAAAVAAYNSAYDPDDTRVSRLAGMNMVRLQIPSCLTRCRNFDSAV